MVLYFVIFFDNSIRVINLGLITLTSNLDYSGYHKNLNFECP